MFANHVCRSAGHVNRRCPCRHSTEPVPAKAGSGNPSVSAPAHARRADRTDKLGAREESGIVRCDACPILCRIKPGKLGACDRYANENGMLVRTDPLVLTRRALETGAPVVPFAGEGLEDWDGRAFTSDRTFVTGIGSGTTYPDYKPAPFIVAAEYEGVDTVTVVSEGIFSYCGVKVKIDTEPPPRPRVRDHPGPRRAGRARHHRRVRLADARHRRGEPAHRRHPPGGPHHLRDAARALQPRAGGARHRRRQHRGDAGRPRAGGERCRGATHAGGLRLGHRRHVRAAVARARGRGDRGRRPHHRGADRAPGGRLSRHAAGRHPGTRAEIHARTLLPGGESQAPDGAAPTSPSRSP